MKNLKWKIWNPKKSLDLLKDLCLLEVHPRKYACKRSFSMKIVWQWKYFQFDYRDLLDAKSSVQQGLIGCFRGLVVNEEILDIYSYMSVHLSEIIKDCKPSCNPNPCLNQAQCKELWSTFECICPNPWAYKGPLCETSELIYNSIRSKGYEFEMTESHYFSSLKSFTYCTNISNDIFSNLHIITLASVFTWLSTWTKNSGSDDCNTTKVM